MLILGIAVVGAVVIYVAKRFLSPADSGERIGFTLDDLRQMHAAGELNDEEFQTAKSQMIGQLRSPAAANTEHAVPPEPGSPRDRLLRSSPQRPKPGGGSSAGSGKSTA